MAEHPAVAFLRLAHQQAEGLARAAGGDRWRTSEYPAWDTVAVYDSSTEPVVYAEGAPTDEEAQHIALHDPAAMLRRVAAERQILAEHADDGYGDCVRCADAGLDVDCGDYGTVVTRGELPWPCGVWLGLAEAWGWEEDAS